MIIKKKKISFKILFKIKNILNKIIFSFGIISILLFVLIISYYYSSGISHRYSPINLIKTIDRVILDRYIGFSIFQIDDYVGNKIQTFKHKLIKNNLDNVQIIINQENLYNLELQRQQRLGKIPKNETDLYNFSNAKIKFKEKNYNIKLRVKGDRLIHWYDKNSTSYKIDLRGPKRIWGLEEFSIQKPITRNYVYEYIFHKLLESNNLISLKYFFVNLSLNDNDQGVYAVEEGFSKELIERNKRRNGPIFGVDEVISDTEKGVVYPNIQYDLYSESFWVSNYPTLISNALSKLNNFKIKNTTINEIFDLKKWATYFAIVDLTNALHASLSKSVKLYYNPVTGKFEPIGFDAQIEARNNNSKNFLLIDFLDIKNKNCLGNCYDRKWFLSFFKDNNGELNTDFINLYFNELNRLSSEEFLIDFNEKYNKKIRFYNSQIYSDNSKKDQGLYKGLGFYIFDDEYLVKRQEYIRQRLKNLNDIQKLQFSLKKDEVVFDNINKFFLKKIIIKCKNGTDKELYITKNNSLDHDKNCNYFIGKKELNITENLFLSSEANNGLGKFSNLLEHSAIENLNDVFYINKDLEIKNNYYFPVNKKLIVKKGVKINFLGDYIILSEGNISFKGTKEEPIIINGINGNGSIVLSNNNYYFDNVIIKNLSFPKDQSKILYGGINIIKSNLTIENTQIENSNSEDAINIISSNSFIKNLNIKKIKADAIDIDFGKLKFENINCENIFNDCLDASGAQVNGSFLTGNNINDKGLSFGENSNGEIINISFQNSRLGIAVKDGSKLKLSKYKLLNNDYDIAVFNKKNEYDSSSLSITHSLFDNDLKYLIGFNNNITKDNIILDDKIDNKLINELFY